MLLDPRMVRRYMVGHEIQDQVHAALRELTASHGKAFRVSEKIVDYIAPHAVWGSNIVLGKKVGKSSAKICEQILVLVNNRNARRTSLPNSH
jgi:hypothetical protein